MTTTKWEQFTSNQPTAEKILRQSLRRKRIAHAYIFEGLKGTGKKGASQLFAQSYFCEQLISGYRPCGDCHQCNRIESGNHPDVHIVKPDGASIKKAQIQALQAEFSKSGMESSKKFYTLISADRMTANAANSLLKFLEEPNSETVAILLTEQPQNMLDTILSRCQVISFRPLSLNLLIQQLVNAGVPTGQAPLLSHLTQNVEEALAFMNDDWFAQARKKVLKLYEAIQKGEGEALIWLQQDWFKHFQDRDQLNIGLQMLMYLYRDLLSIQLGSSEQLIYPNLINELKHQALTHSQSTVLNRIEYILQAKRMLDAHTNAQLLMEQMVLNLQEGSTSV